MGIAVVIFSGILLVIADKLTGGNGVAGLSCFLQLVIPLLFRLLWQLLIQVLCTYGTNSGALGDLRHSYSSFGSDCDLLVC